MSSGCGDVLSLADLQTAKKHQLFEAEVITGKQGGVAGGADIDYAANQATGQTQKTLPAILRDLGFTPASWDFSTGGTLSVNDRDKVVYDPVSKTWYSYAGLLPVTVPAGFNPVGNIDWTPQTDPTLRDVLGMLTKVAATFVGPDKTTNAAGVSVVRTLGYKTVGDGGGATYRIDGSGAPNTSDGISYFTTADGIKFTHIEKYNSLQVDISEDLSINQDTKVNSLAAFAKAEGQKSLQFSQINVRADADLIEMDGIIFEGEGEIISSNNNNYYKQVYKTTDKIETGRINMEGDLSTLRNQLKSGYTTNVVFVGDSLTQGAHRKADNYWWVKKLQTALYELGSCAFYNRGLAGLSIEDFVTKPGVDASYHAPYEQPWFNPASSNTWADYVEALSPTVVIMAFGMNNPNAQDYQKILNARNRLSSMVSKPTVVWVTSPMRTTSLSAENSGVKFGTYPGNEYSNNSAISTRLVAKRFGDYVIDVNRMSNIVMNGMDPLQSRLDRWAGLYRESTYKFTPANKVSGGGASPVTVTLSDSEPVNTNTMFRDAVVAFDTAASIPNFTAIKLSFRKDVGSASEVLFQIEPSEIGLYSVKDNTLQKVGTWSASPLGKSLRFEVIGSRARLYVNESIAIDESVRESTFLSKISVLGFSTTNTILSNFVITATGPYDYQRQTPSLTADEVFSVIYGDGGNGLNHPNTRGEKAIYDPAVVEFVSDIVKTSVRIIPMTLKSGISGTLSVSARNGTNVLSVDGMNGAAVSSDDLASLPNGIAFPTSNAYGVLVRSDGGTLPVVVNVNGKLKTTGTMIAGNSYSGTIIW